MRLSTVINGICDYILLPAIIIVLILIIMSANKTVEPDYDYREFTNMHDARSYQRRCIESGMIVTVQHEDNVVRMKCE